MPDFEVQIDGGEQVPTLREALERATYKVSFTLPTGERVRLVRLPVESETGATVHLWIYEPFMEAVGARIREAFGDDV